ncbi:YbhB/YbcL family Raf kinase inhibitor-like protein [Actinotignum urinale]|uniref:YbhB/YbcL family Raf kinase inhibitor-like protein n=1 Tax=Actinotignum urinale TaxID=190146 RepID=UPI0003B5AA20|nr:YbhB/YbcL family Raf kinase inhibitor-like protein [Actinotignum urinale]MDY5160207.1 YbhB/YbcL family Raf kinase inhibitor-like protein [Actinotignum urinale]
MREYEPYKDLPAGQVDLHLRSTDFADGASLPETATGAGTRPLGADKNPQLSWDKAPEGTKSLLISCYDPDAPTPSGYWHWVAINVDPETTSIAAGGSNDMPEGTLTLKNDGGAPTFQGATPPQGHGPHRYIFAVLALDTVLELDRETRPAIAYFLSRPHVLGRGLLTGTWEN